MKGDEKNDEPESILEPVVKIKEEAMERSFNELNEFFSQQEEAKAVDEDNQISFNQDNSGLFHCEAGACTFSTHVRASIQQHVRQVISLFTL